MTDEIEWLVPPPAVPLTGDEKFAGLGGTTVRDFWRFALGDLRMNNARGYLAEFLVGQALGVENLTRTEWDLFDLVLGDITIEVKSSARLQSWEQRKVSDLKFTGLQGTRYHPRAPGNQLDPLGKRLNAMVYVFCAHTITEHDKYDQLDLSQWEFYVLPRDIIAATGSNSLTIGRVRELTHGPTAWSQLRTAIETAAVEQKRDDDDTDWWKEPRAAESTEVID